MNGIIGFIFITSLLASGRGDPVPCGVTKRFARLSDTYTVYFTTCYDPKEVYVPSCQCPGFQNITNAWFWRDDASKKRMLKHNSSSFWVTSSELHIHTGGRHWFHFEYSYRCHSLTLCKQGHIKLELRVANFHLRPLNTSSMEHASNIRFLCSSHLNNSRTVEVRFHFKSLDGRTLNAPCLVNQSETIPYHNKHWLIHRNRETHDCILEIRNVNQDTDAGEYRCDGALPVHGRIEYAWSNPENITVSQNQSSPVKPFEEGTVIGIAIATGFTVLLLLAASVRVCVMICKRRNPPPAHPPPAHPRVSNHVPNPAPNPAANPAPLSSSERRRNDHAAVAAVLLVDGADDETEPLLRPCDPLLGRSSGVRATPKRPKTYEAFDTKGCDGVRKKTKQWTDHSLQAPTIEGPPMEQNDLTGHSSPPISPEQDPAHFSFTLNDKPSTKESSSESTDSSKEKLHGSFTTEEAVEYVRSQSEPPSHTPESDAPFDDNLQCPKCGRKYREGQIQSFRAHRKACQGN